MSIFSKQKIGTSSSAHSRPSIAFVQVGVGDSDFDTQVAFIKGGWLPD